MKEACARIMSTWLSSMRRDPVRRKTPRLKRTRAASACGPLLVARRRPYGRSLTRAIATIVLVTFNLPAVVPARAEVQLILPEPPNLLNDYLLAKSTDDYPLPGTTGLFKATPEQGAALVRLQQQAIANTITDHFLGADGLSAPQSWGRDEALIRLWALFRKAAFAVKSGTATPDEQRVNTWLQNVLLRHNVRQAVAAGLEYVKYAGLDHERYRQIVSGLLLNEANGGASEAYCDPGNTSTLTCGDFNALYNFMQQGFTSPKNYWAWTDGTNNSTKIQTATEGYCAYRSPSTPAGVDDFPAYPDPDVDNAAYCLSPGPLLGCLFDCNPGPPAYESFQTWGAMLASQNLTSGAAVGATSQDFAEAWSRIATAMAIGGTSIFALGGFTAGYFAGLAGFMAAANAPLWTAVTVNGISGIVYSAPTFSSAQIAGTAAAGSASAIVAGVVLFIVGTFLESYQIAMSLSVPQKLAHLIQATARDYKDMASAFDNPDDDNTLFSLFVAATAPMPRTNCVKINMPTQPDTCLNPPTPPAASLDDAAFRVWNDGQTADQAVLQNTITRYDKTTTLTHTARLHGTWFIVTSVDLLGNLLPFTYDTGGAGNEYQTLKILYTDWNDVHRDALLLPGNNGFSFVSVGLGRESSTDSRYAWFRSDTLKYVDAAGNKKLAKVASDVAEPPTVDPEWTPDQPLEGNPVTFTANGSTAVGTTLFYEWKYQMSEVFVPMLNRWLVCGLPPCYGPSFFGDGPEITFPRSGDFTVVLTATNSVGRLTTHPFTVSVRDVPPKITLAPTCNVSVCQPPFNATLWTPGQTTFLSGTITHVGSLDIEKLTIDWGDETTSSNTCTTSTGCSPLGSVLFTSGYRVPDMTWIASHTYAAPGVYTVKATASEHPGGTDTETITESILYRTAVGISPSSTTSVYGQPVTLTATVGAVGPVPSGTVPTGTVTFFDGPTTLGTGTVGAGGVATFTMSLLGVGTHSLRATYGGDQAFRSAPEALAIVIPVTLTVNKAATSSAVATSASQSVFGQPVTFTATVSPTSQGAGTPTGTVEFKDGNATICAKVVNGTGQATCTTSALAVAGHSITAAYGGDANFTGSTSAAGSLAVNKAATSTALGSSKPVSTEGDAVTLTATVTVTAPGARHTEWYRHVQGRRDDVGNRGAQRGWHSDVQHEQLRDRRARDHGQLRR